MAARLNNRHQEFVKAKIQASQLVNRLQNHALGKMPKGQKPLDDSQIRAADILLKKVLSDAPKILATDPKNPIIPTGIVIEGVRAVSKKE